MSVELEFVMIKPDGVKRGLIGEIISRIERKGLKIKALKMIKMSKEMAEELYAEHKGKPFFNDLVEYVTSGPVVVMIVEGPKAVQVVRKMIGATDGAEAEPGSIRGDFALSKARNIVHATDSPEKVEKEASIFFKLDELVDYDYLHAIY
ncbi:nucleoside diphosphate kinase [Ignicoccus islandicus DSM 13165]|uniref:Nucleoside diphosphate kinase n=1 Tax=Ignicoccus islandicus DSM 13165 TaxID=940295 RepID=A0A0U3F7R4_9CREN|nr:nucleoside-diphosphate kinase [Ignicoccus islandicus]ALU12072.1 nucleoside diphosphate kinase [Ignicoccus islandicus DSM 13165]